MEVIFIKIMQIQARREYFNPFPRLVGEVGISPITLLHCASLLCTSSRSRSLTLHLGLTLYTRRRRMSVSLRRCSLGFAVKFLFSVSLALRVLVCSALIRYCTSSASLTQIIISTLGREKRKEEKKIVLQSKALYLPIAVKLHLTTSQNCSLKQQANCPGH